MEAPQVLNQRDGRRRLRRGCEGPLDDRTATRSASRELMLDRDTARPVKDTALTMSLSAMRSRIAATLAARGGVK